MNDFQYLAPKGIKEALEMLDRYGKESKLIAGGTDLLNQIKEQDRGYAYLIGLSQLDSLSYIKDDPQKRIVSIGSATLIQDIAEHPIVKEGFSFLVEACEQLGSMQIRNLATIGGNLVNAAPSAETAPPLLVADATLVLSSTAGEREIDLESFFIGPGVTDLRSNELVREVRLPRLPENARGSYLRLTQRRALDIAIVNVAVCINIRSDKVCEWVRIAVGACAPVPFRARRAEEILTGSTLDKKNITRAAEQAAAEAKPITDIRATSEYRRQMIEVLVVKAFNHVLEAS